MKAYARLLREPGIARLMAAQLTARLPTAVIPLALLIHLQSATGSYALAGIGVALESLGTALSLPLMSRLAASIGVVRVLIAATAVQAAVLLFIAFGPASTASLLAACVIAGISVPPVMPIVRALVPEVATPGSVPALYALDTTAQELLWIVGPVLATFVATAFSSRAALVLCVGLAVAGIAWLVTARSVLSARLPRPGGRFGSVLLQRSVVLTALITVALVISYGMTEVAIVAGFGEEGLSAGLVLACAAAGSLVGGIVFGHRELGLLGTAVGLLVVAAGTAAAGLVTGVVPTAITLFASGLGFAPALAALYVMISRTVHERSRAEAFGWLATAGTAGSALGAASGGFSVDGGGPAQTLLVAGAAAAAAAVLLLTGRAAGPLPGLSRR